MSGELTSTAGIAALAAGTVALIALIIATVAVAKLRSLRSGQKAVMGESGQRDLIAHAEAMQHGFIELRELVDSTFATVERRLAEHGVRLGEGVSRTAVVRYDAYRELSGQQSSTMALLNDHGSGLVLSSILHRDQARIYVKDVQTGESQFDLSPEEKEAIASAMAPRDQTHSRPEKS